MTRTTGLFQQPPAGPPVPSLDLETGKTLRQMFQIGFAARESEIEPFLVSDTLSSLGPATRAVTRSCGYRFRVDCYLSVLPPICNVSLLHPGEHTQ